MSVAYLRTSLRKHFLGSYRTVPQTALLEFTVSHGSGMGGPGTDVTVSHGSGMGGPGTDVTANLAEED